MLQRDEVSLNDHAWKEGLADWVSLSEILAPNPTPPRSRGPGAAKKGGFQNRQGVAVSLIGDYSRSTLQENETPLYYTNLHWVVFIKAGMVYLLLGLFLGGLPIIPKMLLPYEPARRSLRPGEM